MADPAAPRLRVHQGSPAASALSALPPVSRVPLERCGPDDRFHDYVLVPYQPPSEATGRLRSLNLLVESFALAGLEREGLEVMRLLREGLGPFRTVWGIKQYGATGSPHGWELYFYDFGREHHDLSIERVRTLLAPAITVDAVEPFPLPWRMFSVELSPTVLRRLASAPLDVYLDMRSYKVRGDRYELENIYTFHDARSGIDEVLHRLRASVHFDHRRDSLARLIPPSLLRCARICVANKRRADAVYFSRLPTPALATFLATNGWPEALSAFVARHADDLSHLLWDVGMDFAREGDALATRKTGVYGTF